MADALSPTLACSSFSPRGYMMGILLILVSTGLLVYSAKSPEASELKRVVMIFSLVFHFCNPLYHILRDVHFFFFS
jgi:hypothetical protein